MTSIITPKMDKIVFIKMIMIVVVTSVGVLQHNINNTTAQEQPPATVKVAAGGGNATAPWTIFVPQEVEISAGESVTWYNPTEAGSGTPYCYIYAR